MAATGLVHNDPQHVETMMRFAEAILVHAGQVALPTGHGTVQLRVGIHSGKVMSGVVGRIRRRYCLFGE